MSVGLRALAIAWLCLVLPGNSGAASGATIDFQSTANKYEVSAPDTTAQEMPRALVEQDQKDLAEHIRWQRDYERRGWEWHLFSTQLLFCIVIGIVAFGLWITYQQFRRDYMGRARARKVRTASPQVAQTPAAESDDTERALPSITSSTIKISPAGLEMTSQIVGLLVLALSVAFFYFYVKEVYPMREIEREKATTSAAETRPH